MTEQEIFEKLKEALDYDYLITDFGDKEVSNLEEYLRTIKYERTLEKCIDAEYINELKTYKEFISYLHDKAIGDKNTLIKCFDDNDLNVFVGYKNVTKLIINNKLYLEFEIDDIKLKAEWQASDNYAVWQQCGVCGDDYSGYLLFPTHKDDEYFCLYYKC